MHWMSNPPRCRDDPTDSGSPPQPTTRKNKQSCCKACNCVQDHVANVLRLWACAKCSRIESKRQSRQWTVRLVALVARNVLAPKVVSLTRRAIKRRRGTRQRARQTQPRKGYMSAIIECLSRSKRFELVCGSLWRHGTSAPVQHPTTTWNNHYSYFNATISTTADTTYTNSDNAHQSGHERRRPVDVRVVLHRRKVVERKVVRESVGVHISHPVGLHVRTEHTSLQARRLQAAAGSTAPRWHQWPGRPSRLLSAFLKFQQIE
jgi:hypothetical protein